MPAAAAPAILARWMAAFEALFTRPTWRNVLPLVAGSILAPGRRTVTPALSIMGLREMASFTNFHRALNRSRWASQAVARRRLALLIRAFASDGPVVIGIDETIERRWGPKIQARGICRDPVRSSHGHFVEASGPRWITLMLLAPIPWAGRVWALPVLTVLAPSQRYAHEHGRRHKTLTDWARHLLILIARWPPERQAIAVADHSSAAIEWLAAVRRHLTLVTRRRLDARLFDPAPVRRPGTVGRPRVSGARPPTLAERLADTSTQWQRVIVTGWDGRSERRLDIISGTALWYPPGKRVPIRWVLVRDVADEFEPQGFLRTDLAIDPLDALRCFVRRWSMEVTFAEARRHLGVETQRQWSDRAISRTTPAPLGLFSLVTLWASEVLDDGGAPRRAAWCLKPQLTSSDALAAVRHRLRVSTPFSTSAHHADTAKIPRTLLQRVTEAARFPA